LRRSRGAVHIAVLLIVSILAPYIHVPSTSSPDSGCTIVPLLAVAENGSGIAIPSRICVISNGGKVTIRGSGVDETVALSFANALTALALYCGDHFLNLSVEVSIEAISSVKGSSASLAVALAVLSLLKPGVFPQNINWSASGVVMIDGFVDPVSGVKEKLSAAARSGVEMVFLPLLNSGEAGGYTNLSTRYVTTLAEFCNHAAQRSNASLESFVDSATLEGVNSLFYADMEKFLNASEKLVGSLGREAEQLFEQYTKSIDQLVKVGHIYSATSLAFSLYLRLLALSLSSGEVDPLELVNEAERIVGEVEAKINSSECLSANSIPVLTTLLDRLEEAKYYLNACRNNCTPEVAAAAYARSMTATSWLKVLQIVNSSAGSCIERHRVVSEIYNVVSSATRSIESRLTPILTLNAIAYSRASRVVELDLNISEVRSAVMELLRANMVRLSGSENLVPYLYSVYSDDVEDPQASLYLLFLANMVSAVTRAVKLRLEGFSATPVIVTERSGATQTPLVRALWLLSAVIVLGILLYYIVEKRSSLRRARPDVASDFGGLSQIFLQRTPHRRIV